MITLFVRLKLRLLRNVLRTSTGPGLVIFTILALILGSSAGLAFRSADSIDRIIFAPILGTALVFTWILGPVLFGASDETIDTTRLALYPLDPGRTAAGLAAAAMVGPGPLAAAVALAGAASQAPTVPTAVLAGAAVILTIALAATSSRLLLTALGSSLRRRRSRDLATVATGVVLGAAGLGLQAMTTFGGRVGRAEMADVADVVRLTPLGWPGDALGRASTGELLVPSVELAATAALVVVVVRSWGSLLARALTEVTEAAETDESAIPLVPVGDGGPVRPMFSVFQKERRYFSRHPRYRVQVVSQLSVLVIGGAPFLAAIIRGDPEAVLLGCIPGLTAGVTGANLLGPDGRSLWAEVLSLRSLTPLLRGRSLAFAGLGLAASVLLTLGSAIWTGGWVFVPAALGAAVGMAFTGSGVGTVTSVLAPTPYPDDSSPNPFATSSPGAGCLPAVLTFSGVLIGLLMAAPILVLLAIARDETAANVAAVILPPIYGLGIWIATTRWAGRRATARAPELLNALARAA